ncbi:hypothetical protein TrispH2_007671 [Trichoplax sp. H2]|nr:hypothetical protein TrispH2_007671 [Trichoplax sp. H2]|eukprot:RDD40247.1 hypothetical protein TrispH2_007671 [Trichoplax sp. H2]
MLLYSNINEAKLIKFVVYAEKICSTIPKTDIDTILIFRNKANFKFIYFSDLSNNTLSVLTNRTFYGLRSLREL